MNPDTGAVKEFATEEEANAAGHTIKVTPEAATVIAGLSPAQRADTHRRFKALADAGVTTIVESDARAVSGSRALFRAYLTQRRRQIRRQKKQ
jgi:hypothetical protein